ncbi:MAG: FAD-binding oxidoreductase [Acidobacteria bacterium]|nr:FAD-binding oxidoreductase [Acidobacteriota bacterium]
MEADPSLRAALAGIVGRDRVLDRPVDRVAFAADASFYRLIPRAVVFAGSVEEVRALFRLSRELRIPMTFRAAGTSLSGQAVSDGILVEVARNWRGIQVLEGGAKVKVQPGVIGAHVNHALRPFRAKMGPDPASINTCTVGGILSNNSSGMCCGVAQNAYHTLESLTFVLPSGTVVDTGAPDADDRFRAAEPALAEGLLALKAELEANAPLAVRIRAKYLTKNTTGYSLNAFLDFHRPVDIFRNLLVGSEGTLAFIAEAVLNSVPDLPVKVTGFLIFPDLHAACAAIVPLKEAGAAALELLDRASLRSVENQPGTPPSFRTLPGGAAALLVEFQGPDESVRAELERLALASAADLTLLEPARFTHDPAEQALMWKIRSGTFPSVGAVRKRGTTVLIEDVAFPIASLADAAVDLTRLFAKHGYPEAILFGHAKDGNLHFVVTQSFNDPAAIDQYERFMDEVVELVVKKYDGALKAEHGTGRNMAPFVEAEWGPEAKAVMEKLKALVDPGRLLNPGVILNADPRCHISNLKPMPGVEEEVDTCIECGYCEPKCPSRELTLTPRQRIVVRREIARLEAAGEDPERLASLRGDFPYMALQTCAVDGLCATACPVGIDTGQLTKLFRKASHSRASKWVALQLARHFAALEPLVRTALRGGHLVQRGLGRKAMPGLTRLLKGVGWSHQWSPEIPHPATALPRTSPEGAQALYFPACISRTMGHLPGESSELSLAGALVALSARAGVPVHIPEGVEGTCCGVPFSSKGFEEAHRHAVNQAIERFWRWSGEGRLPIVVDTSPCTHGLRTCRAQLSAENQARFDRLRILDSVTFAHDELLPRLLVSRKAGPVVLHPVCSVTKMDLAGKLEGLAKACSEKVVIPRDAGCCGFAGDRGFTHPELTAAATRQEAKEVAAGAFEGHYASSRTCEIGLTRATGRVYRSILHLLEESTRA